MGHFGVPLEVATSIIACVAVGIGIDYGLHFLTRYRFLRRSESSEDAIETTFSITGKGIMINAFSVALGFAVLAFSGFVPLIRFGLFVSLTMLLTGFFSLTFLPALILLFHSKKVKTEDTASEVL
jgi:predicted RND superfamily exporter protein